MAPATTSTGNAHADLTTPKWRRHSTQHENAAITAMPTATATMTAASLSSSVGDNAWEMKMIS